LKPIEPSQLADDNSLPGIKRPDVDFSDQDDEGFAEVDNQISTGSVAVPTQREAQ
jgi:hypothetical protein